MRDGGLRQLERKHLPKFHLASIETPLTGSGVPDMNYCYKGLEGWIENKKANGWRVKFQVEQIGWIARRKRAGGRVFIAVRRMSGGDDELYLYDGAVVEQLAAQGMRGTRHVLHCAGGPARWDWRAVAWALAPGTQVPG